MRKSPPDEQPQSVVPADEAHVFREAVQDVTPLPDNGQVLHEVERPQPIARQRQLDEQQVLVDALSDYIPLSELANDDDLPFYRPGVARQVLKKMKSGSLFIEAELDLHGLASDAARVALVAFLADCLRQRIRCVRIIHGKGLRSPNREPVLKRKVRSWLMQRDEILAFCRARQEDGGGGALIVLLKRDH